MIKNKESIFNDFLALSAIQQNEFIKIINNLLSSMKIIEDSQFEEFLLELISNLLKNNPNISKNILFTLCNNLASVHIIQNKKRAKFYIQKSAQFLQDGVGNPCLSAILFENISNFYFCKGELQKAQKYAEDALLKIEPYVFIYNLISNKI